MTITAQQILESAPKRFRAEKAQQLQTTFHFVISGDENFEWSLIIADGNCRLEKKLVGIADCVVKTTAKTYVELETGKANPQMALMMGRVKVSNLGAMMQFAKCFRKFDIRHLQQDKIVEMPVQYTQREPRKGPLQGIKVLDFTRLLPGPMATMLLADMGADVIKIEDPDSPDYVRDFAPLLGDTSAFYYALNRNKRSLAVNFLSPAGKEILLELVQQCDVLIEQYRPGVMKNFGLDYPTLKAHNPRLVYVSITGYGQQGSWAQAAGHDLNYIARAGLLGVTGTEKDEPIIPGFQLADIAGGSYMAMNAVMAALLQRVQTGEGDYVDVAMTDCVLPLLALPFAEYQVTRMRQSRGKFQLSGGLANYNVYRCSDGKYLAVGSLEPKFWNNLCKQLGKEEWREKVLGDEATHYQLKQTLQQLLLEKTRAEWLQFFEGTDACITAVNEMDELENDSYLQDRNLFVRFDIAGYKFNTINQPLKFANSATATPWVAPKLGEDTLSILRELQWSEEKIQTAVNQNIVKAST